MDRFGVALGVDHDDPPGIAVRDLVVGARHGALELDPLALDAVARVAVAARGALRVDPQQQRQVRLEPVGREPADLPRALDAEPAGGPLVGDASSR